MTRLGIRRRLLLAVLAAVTAALAAMLVGFNLLLTHTLSHNIDDVLRARVAAELSVVRTKGDRVVVTEAPDDATVETNVWVFSRGRTLEAPRGADVLTNVARQLAAGPTRFTDVPSTDARLYAVPIVVNGRRLGTVVAGASLAPYEETQRTALLGSLALGAAVLLLVAVAARWLLASSLRPVARMTRQAAAWSERDLDRRFGLGEPRDELTELAATLDALLDRLAASLRREQQFSAELSHELRTPLSRVIAETELALRRERSGPEYRAALEVVRENAGQLTRTVDALVAAARHEAGAGRGTADAYAVAQQAVEACASLTGDRRLDVQVDRPASALRVGVEADLAQRILQPIVENACRYGDRKIHLALRRRNGVIVYTVDDDGPGVGEQEIDEIFAAGVRGNAGRQNGAAGAGLGLALARRLARSADGDVEAVASRDGGRFIVRLPGG
jgi:signal transduction histidine kinase